MQHIPTPDHADLKARVDAAESIKAMRETDGWKLIENLLTEQLEAYQSDIMLNCSSWDDYQDKRGKVFGIRLLLVDIEDYIRQGEQAQEELTKLNT